MKPIAISLLLILLLFGGVAAYLIFIDPAELQLLEIQASLIPSPTPAPTPTPGPTVAPTCAPPITPVCPALIPNVCQPLTPHTPLPAYGVSISNYGVLDSRNYYIPSAIQSPSNLFSVAMQSDGNLVIYNTKTGGPTWATGTSGQGYGPYQLSLNSDGNLVLTDGGGTTRWQSNSGNIGQGVVNTYYTPTPAPTPVTTPAPTCPSGQYGTPPNCATPAPTCPPGSLNYSAPCGPICATPVPCPTSPPCPTSAPYPVLPTPAPTPSLTSNPYKLTMEDSGTLVVWYAEPVSNGDPVTVWTNTGGIFPGYGASKQPRASKAFVQSPFNGLLPPSNLCFGMSCIPSTQNICQGSPLWMMDCTSASVTSLNYNPQTYRFETGTQKAFDMMCMTAELNQAEKPPHSFTGAVDLQGCQPNEVNQQWFFNSSTGQWYVQGPSTISWDTNNGDVTTAGETGCLAAALSIAGPQKNVGLTLQACGSSQAFTQSFNSSY